MSRLDVLRAPAGGSTEFDRYSPAPVFHSSCLNSKPNTPQGVRALCRWDCEKLYGVVTSEIRAVEKPGGRKIHIQDDLFVRGMLNKIDRKMDITLHEQRHTATLMRIYNIGEK